ncbi:hypothetical protein ACOMHN_001315 [Nucella lapillus]
MTIFHLVCCGHTIHGHDDIPSGVLWPHDTRPWRYSIWCVVATRYTAMTIFHLVCCGHTIDGHDDIPSMSCGNTHNEQYKQGCHDCCVLT